MELKIMIQEANYLQLTLEEYSQFMGISVPSPDSRMPAVFPDLHDSGVNLFIQEARTAYALSSDDNQGGENDNHQKPDSHFERQGEYTSADYYTLSDHVRVELIDGFLIKMESPSWNHQAIIAELLFQIKSYIKKKKGDCQVIPSPIDVRLDQDDKTILQPDLSIICKKDRITSKRVEGAPAFIAEVLSPSTQSLDKIKKLNKYKNAGVEEYWIVDPLHQIVQVCLFESTAHFKTEQYTFQDKIPVHIFPDLKIDLTECELI